MSAIGGALNSINSPLLNEIQKLSPTSRNTAVTSVDAVPSTTKVDRFDSSQAASLFKQLRDLQSANPAEFKQVLTDGAAQLKDAASKQTDPQAAKFLNNLADRFQKAADTGDLSAIHPRTPDGGNAGQAGGVRGHHGCHHHGGVHKAESENNGDADDSSGAAASAPSVTSASTGETAPNLFSLLASSSAPDQSQSPQDLFALLNSDQSQSGSSQIQSLLASFVTSNPA